MSTVPINGEKYIHNKTIYNIQLLPWIESIKTTASAFSAYSSSIEKHYKLPVNVVVLDDFDDTGEKLRTSEMLISNGIQSANITLVNPEKTIQLCGHSMGISVFDGMLSNYFDLLIKQPFLFSSRFPNIFIVDTCCGIAKLEPDLVKLFGSIIPIIIALSGHIVFGVAATVFNTRTCSRTREEWLTIMETLANIAPLSLRAQYSCNPSEDGQMMLLWFTFVKLTSHHRVRLEQEIIIDGKREATAYIRGDGVLCAKEKGTGTEIISGPIGLDNQLFGAKKLIEVIHHSKKPRPEPTSSLDPTCCPKKCGNNMTISNTSTGHYRKGWICDLCETLCRRGNRWHCNCSSDKKDCVDICFICMPVTTTRQLKA
jgi:hypothetical protein